MAMRPTIGQCTVENPMPMAAKPTTAPMMVWVVETGQPKREAISSQVPAASRAGEHAENQQFRLAAKQGGINNATPDGAGDPAAGQYGTGKLEDGSDEDRLLDGDRLGANGGCHGVGDVVGADPPGHEQANRAARIM
jgi:hypothetical protein